MAWAGASQALLPMKISASVLRINSRKGLVLTIVTSDFSVISETRIGLDGRRTAEGEDRYHGFPNGFVTRLGQDEARRFCGLGVEQHHPAVCFSQL